ncbi:MAG: metallophosphoesterase family protein [Planctomycetes bacterium]|nr:metallophosphoesterase family protein [Planctomycetota bacterium]NOG55949.1 metallophosphoesterase family protein [Planctomycetota bacterium]
MRGPYLQRTSWSETVIRWRTDFESDSVVMYGPSPDNLVNEVSDGTLTTEHEITVSGLLPETVYYYSIGSSTEVLAGGDADHSVKTSPPPGTDVPVRIWVLGDSGTGDANAAAVRDAYQSYAQGEQTDIVLMLGDNAYNSGTDEEYQAAVFDMYPMLLRQTTFWPAYGNHDAISADANTETGPYFNIFSLPRAGEVGGLPSGTEAYYSFDYGSVHFICLDSQESSRLPGGNMMNWLEADLDETGAKWVIAYWHHPPYTHGSHNSDNRSDSGARMFDMRERAVPVLEAANADLVLNGHSHSYERSYLLDGHYGTSSTLTPEMILDGGDGRADGNGAYLKPTRKTPHTGSVYTVAGSSGLTSGGTLDHPAMFFSANQLGSVVIDIVGNDLTAQFLDSNGVVQDWYTISKTDSLNDCVTLNARDLYAGLTATFTVSGGVPGSQTVVLWGVVDGTFQLNNGGWCVDFGFFVPELEPLSRLAGYGTFDETGRCVIEKRIPFQYFGADVRFQAAMSGTCPDPCMSNIIRTTIR